MAEDNESTKKKKEQSQTIETSEFNNKVVRDYRILKPIGKLKEFY